MTAQQYFHIYRESTDQDIFVDDHDREVFIGFLKEYSSQNQDQKKTFAIRGRNYIGTPHRPKNFANDIVLVDYKLTPGRFDITIKEIVAGSTEKFIRALSTRYAIYFNKKYARSGPLFKDPSVAQKIEKPSLNIKTENVSNVRIPEIIFSMFILLCLSTYSLIKIESSDGKSPLSTSNTQVLGTNIVVIKTYNIDQSINIHALPESSSKIIGLAKHGYKFESLSLIDGWHQVKLFNGSLGYINEQFLQTERKGGL